MIGNALLIATFSFFALNCSKYAEPMPSSQVKKSDSSGLENRKESFQTGAGSTVVYTETTSQNQLREKSYIVHWKSARLNGNGAKRIYATAYEVLGTIFKLGKPQSTFAANKGVIDRTDGILTLVGQVQFHSLVRETTVKCNQATFIQSQHLIKAIGNVRAQGQGWAMGSSPEIWMSEDLSTVATPDLFSSIAHNSSSSNPK